jgi:DNA sulfur modification protein DndD
MILKSIYLHNFRPFYGEHKINLSTTKSKPIILVRAFNDVGKTSLFKAIQFCLYGLESKEKTDSHVNRTAAGEGDGITKVTLLFDHKGKRHQLTRSIKFTKRKGMRPLAQKDKLEVLISGKPRILDSKADENQFVEAILPRDASQFFLFDGEEIQKYTKRTTDEHVKESIEMVLGIKELLNARADLKAVELELSQELDLLIEIQAKEKNEAREVRQLGERIEEFQKNAVTILDKIEAVKKQIDDCDSELSRTEGIRDKIKQRSDLESEVQDTNEKLKALETDRREFNENLGILFIGPLLNELVAIQRDSFSKWKTTAISHLLAENNEICICGRPIDEHIRQSFETVATEGIGLSPASSIVECASDLVAQDDPERLRETFYDLVEKERSLQNALLGYKQEIDTLGLEIDDVEGLDKQTMEIEETRKRAAEAKDKLIEERGGLLTEINRMTKEHSSRQDKLADETTDDAVKAKQLHKESCHACRMAMQEAIELLVDKIRSKLQEAASDIFVHLTNAPELYKGLEITEDFRLKVRTTGGQVRDVWVQDPSAGQSQIIAMSFLSALNQYTAREAPIIIDTPIGRLDPIHKDNLIEFLPGMGGQVVVLYQPNELREHDIKTMGSSISREYELKRDKSNPDITLISLRN